MASPTLRQRSLCIDNNQKELVRQSRTYSGFRPWSWNPTCQCQQHMSKWVNRRELPCHQSYRLCRYAKCLRKKAANPSRTEWGDGVITLLDRKKFLLLLVSPLFPKDTLKSLGVITNPKSGTMANILKDNVFVFASTTNSLYHVSGCHVIQEMWEKLNLESKECITATRNCHGVCIQYARNA